MSSSEKLSITVLAHLWPLQNNNPIIEEFCGKGKWWDKASNYYNLKNKLKINSQFAINSFVTDAIRLGIDKKNRQLLYEEISILKPKLVVCVGNSARDIIGMRYLDQDTKFHYVKFPKYHNEIEGYEQLFGIMEKILRE